MGFIIGEPLFPGFGRLLRFGFEKYLIFKSPILPLIYFLIKKEINGP